MVTKSKLFEIFDAIKDEDLSFCVLCLRNQNETKLVKQKAFAMFMDTFNHRFENSMICYMCEAKAESALKFVSMVHFAMTIEKIMQDIFSGYYKYHSMKQKLLDLLAKHQPIDKNKFKRTPIMADVFDCEEMVDVIRERTRFRHTDTLTLHACSSHLDTGQKPPVCKSYDSPAQRTPEPAPVSIQSNLMDNIILFPAPLNGCGPKLLDHGDAVLYRNILKSSLEPTTSSRPTPDGNLKNIHSQDLVVQRVISGNGGVVYVQNEPKNRSFPSPAAIKQPATQSDTNGSNLYSEDFIRKLLEQKIQNDEWEIIKVPERTRVGSGTPDGGSGGQTSDLRSVGQMSDLRSGGQTSDLRSVGQMSDLRSGGQTSDLRSVGQISDLRSGGQTSDLRSVGQMSDLRSGGQTSDLRSGGQTSDLRSVGQMSDLRSGGQTSDLRSGGQTSDLRSGEQVTSLRGRKRAVSLRSGEQATSSRRGKKAVSSSSGNQAPNSSSNEQTSKEAVMDPRKVDWEDKIPMDLISFVEGAGPGQNSRNLIYLPDYGRQILSVDPPFTACITDVRSERKDNQDSDDDLIVVNNATPCIVID